MQNEKEKLDDKTKQEALDSVSSLENGSSSLKDAKIHTMPDKFLKNLPKIKVKKSGKGILPGKKPKIINKNLIVGVSVGLIFIIVLALAAWFFVRSINQAPEEDLSLQTLEDSYTGQESQEDNSQDFINTCSADKCEDCGEEQCLMLQETCHLEVVYEVCEYNANEECVVQKCTTGQSQIDRYDENDFNEYDEYDDEEEIYDYEEEEINDEFVLTKDSDYDGLTDVEEVVWGTNPDNLDTDNDSYLDGKELVSLYSPLGVDKTLKDEDAADTFIDETYGYSFIYPNEFNLIRVDEQEGNLIIQSEATEEFFNILILDNETEFDDVMEWYLFDKPNITESDIEANKQKTELGGEDAIRTEDGLNIYSLVDGKIFLISYSPSMSNELNFVATFNMMLNSFEFFENPF